MRIDHMATEIIDMYVNKNLTTVDIAKQIGCSSSGVGRLLEKNGIDRFHTPNELVLPDGTVDSICKRYIDGETTIEIGHDVGLCDNTIAKILRDNGVKIRRAVRRSQIVNHDYFSKIDTPDKAYFLGWMISDGSVIRPKSRPCRSRIISLEVHNKDRHILEMFAESLGASQDSVKHFAKRNHNYIRFASEQMAKDLERYGVVENKTWISYLPMIDRELMPHLIRGIFDGDGTVTRYKKDGCVRFAFYGSKQICEDIRDYLHSEIGLNINKVSKSTCYHVWWGGPGPCGKFSEYIYSNCGKYVLDRKRDVFYT